MALTKCKECGKEVSKKAEKCPHCGAPAKKKTKWTTWVIAGLFAWAMFYGLLSPDNGTSTSKPQAPPKSPREQKIESQFSGWSGSHTVLEKTIISTMNDPDSYEHVETRYGDKGDYLIISTKFRGKNKFGGVITQVVTAKVDLNGNIIEIVSQD